MGLLEKEPERLVKELALYSDVPIEPGRTLIILDEIQECEEALNSLKYFCEDAPQYHIIAAGSLLGVAVKRKNMSVPVGKVRTMKIHPLSFKEFLAKSDPDTYDFIENISAIGHLPEIILNKTILEYRRYSICGGMPAAATKLLENKYSRKFSPEYRIRYSFRNLQYNDGLLSCPSPLAGWTRKLLELCR